MKILELIEDKNSATGSVDLTPPKREKVDDDDDDDDDSDDKKDATITYEIATFKENRALRMCRMMDKQREGLQIKCLNQ
ncbi:hypothetical protein ACLOJK_017508 [Asimina triloba]